MKITVIAAGKIKEKWVKEGIEEYTGRLKRFASVNIIEIADEKVPEKFSEKEIQKALEKEAEKIIKKIPTGSWTAALSPNGRTTGSKELADLLKEKKNSGVSHFVFIIGSSNGLSEKVLNKCASIISFGPNVFPHQLFRIFLLEQLYRAEKINAGHTYHK